MDMTRNNGGGCDLKLNLAFWVGANREEFVMVRDYWKGGFVIAKKW